MRDCRRFRPRSNPKRHARPRFGRDRFCRQAVRAGRVARRFVARARSRPRRRRRIGLGRRIAADAKTARANPPNRAFAFFGFDRRRNRRRQRSRRPRLAQCLAPRRAFRRRSLRGDPAASRRADPFRQRARRFHRRAAGPRIFWRRRRRDFVFGRNRRFVGGDSSQIVARARKRRIPSRRRIARARGLGANRRGVESTARGGGAARRVSRRFVSSHRRFHAARAVFARNRRRPLFAFRSLPQAGGVGTLRRCRRFGGRRARSVARLSLRGQCAGTQKYRRPAHGQAPRRNGLRRNADRRNRSRQRGARCGGGADGAPPWRAFIESQIENDDFDLAAAWRRLESIFARAAARREGGDVARAARLLGLDEARLRAATERDE